MITTKLVSFKLISLFAGVSYRSYRQNLVYTVLPENNLQLFWKMNCNDDVVIKQPSI